jgi:glycerol-3-phosphate dehydrogenase (NAD(P)+)
MSSSWGSTRPKVALLGGGKLAHAALLMLGKNADVVAWARSAAARAALAAVGVDVGEDVRAVVAAADVIFLAVPAPAFTEVVDAFAEATRGDQILVHGSRGVGAGFALPHQLVRERCCIKKTAAIGGPLYLDDAAAGRPLSAALASRFDEVVAAIRALTVGTPLRIHATRDVVGVEVAGALSNVGHLAAGLAHGAGLGETDQGLLAVRALLEAGAVGAVLGADRATFNGLAGLGDLIPRQVTSSRRQREAGAAIAAGAGVDDFDVDLLEGAVTAREGARFAERHGLKLPLVAAVDEIVRDAAPARATLERVLSLDLGLKAA